MSGNTNTFIKDPATREDYHIDWSSVLSGDGDTITGSVWTIDLNGITDGLTNYLTTNDTMTATIWLTGGSLSQLQPYAVTNKITTSKGRILVQTLYFVMQKL